MIFYLVLLFALFQVSSSAPVSVASLLKEVEEDLRAERYLEARQKLEEAVKRVGDNPSLWGALSLAHDRLNEIEPAIAALRGAITLAPRDAQLHFRLGSLYGRKDDVDKALDEYRKGLALNPTETAGNENYVSLLMRTGRYKEAIDALLRLKTERASSLPLRLALIESFFRAGMALEGETETQELLASRIASPQDRVKLASTLLENQQLDLAEQVLKDALVSEPDLVGAHGVLGLLYQKQGRYEQAEKELSRAIESTSSSAYSLALAQVRLVRYVQPRFANEDVAWFQNTAPGVAYVGSQRCAACHEEIYESYRKTAMGRSMAIAGESQSGARIQAPVTVFDTKQNSYFQVVREGNHIYQSSYALDSDGKERYRQTEKMAYVIGAGSQGIGHIFQRGDYLFQAPLSFYARPEKWALSPGYEIDNLGFSRPVLEECIVCHSGKPQAVSGRSGLYRNPPFRELAIGCENCHGPGELHISQRAKQPTGTHGFDSTIVNPAKLPAWLSDNVCMSCHQGGDVRVLQPGRNYSDYRPGMPLDFTVATFKVPLKRENPQSDLLEHNFSLRLSRCSRDSGGRMRCTTCHDPHRLIISEEKVQYYRQRCLSCHSDASCKLPLKDRTKNNPSNDCSGCHMPKRDLQEIAHAALTNHRIVRWPDAPYPEEAFRFTTPDLPDLIHVSAIPGRNVPPVPPLTVLQAYRTLRLNRYDGFEESYARVLNQLAQSKPDDPEVLTALAQTAIESQNPQARSEAIRYLSRSIELGSTNPNGYLMLGDLLARSGRAAEGIEVLDKGMLLAPYAKEFFQSKARCLISVGRHADAVVTINKALELFPGDTHLNALLAQEKQSSPRSDGLNKP